MKFAIVFAAVLAVVMARALDDSKNAQILRYDNDNIGIEGYNYAVETSDGKSHNEQGTLKRISPEEEAIVVRGSFSYIGDDGITYTVNYVADENGFQPEAAHLPVAPQA